MLDPPEDDSGVWSPPQSAIQEEDADASDGIVRLPARLARYATAHRRAEDMAAHLAELERFTEATSCRDCGSYLVFRHYYVVDVVRLRGARFCKRHLICPLCAIRRGGKALRVYKQRIELVTSQRRDLRPYMLVLTVKNGPDALERFDHLMTAVRRLVKRRRDFLSKGGTPTEFAKIVGAVGSYEVKRGANSGLHHPHVNVLSLCSDRMNADALRSEWHEITGDSVNLYITPIYGDSIVDGLCEVLKYAVKMSDMSVEDNLMWHDELRSRRLLFSFGNLWGVKVPDDLTDDEEELLADEPYVDRMFRYFREGAESGYALDFRTAPSKSRVMPSSVRTIAHGASRTNARVRIFRPPVEQGQDRP